MADGSGTCFDGVISETWSAVCVPWLFVFAAAFMAAALVGLLVNHAYSGVYICGASAVAFALIAGLLFVARPMAFDADSKDLLGRLRVEVLARFLEPSVR